MTWDDFDGDGTLSWVAAAEEAALVSMRFPEAVARLDDWRAPQGQPRGGNLHGIAGTS